MRGQDIPWLTPELRDHMYHRDYLRRQAKRLKTPAASRRYKNQRKRTRKCLNEAKKSHFDNVLKESGNNTKKLWTNLKNLLPKTQKGTTKTVMVDGAEVSDSSGIANAFNAFFTSVGKKLAQKFDGQTRTPPIRTTCSNRFKFKPVSVNQICKLLSGLNTSKAHGVDGIVARSLKTAAKELAFPLATIFNYSLCTGTIPGEWKQAQVTPVFKDGSRQDTSNYRPISVIPLCMKVFEKVVHAQLYDHISRNNLLNQFQSGFRPGYSTATALTDVSDYFYDQRRLGNMSGAIYLDLKKAFDTVDPDILLQKLFAIGIQETEFQWFKCYFANRSQSVSVNGASSSTLPIECGVPQGSILGPLLFTLYINDLPEVTKHSKVVLYADDTALFVSSKNLAEIQTKLSEDLDSVSRWLAENRLTLNAKKTKCMLFGSPQKLARVREELRIQIDGEFLEHVKVFKYLGLWFDSVLNWKHHVDCVAKKISQRIGIQSRIRPYISADTAKILYESMIAPIISYGDLIWSKGPVCNTVRMQRLQNRAGRTILRCNRRTHIADIHSTLGWMTCEDSIKLHKCIMVGKCIFGKVPSYLRGKFMFARDFHSHLTRHAHTGLFVPRVTSNAGKKLLCYDGAVTFNSLPSNIQASLNFTTFSRQCKKHFKNK